MPRKTVEGRREYDNEHRERTREHHRAYMREWYKTPAGKAASARSNERRKAKKRANPDISRAEKLRRRYGITLEQYEEMFQRQGGGCAICGSPGPAGKPLHVDHDHMTGEVRDLLCQHCNHVVGFTKDSLEVARAIVAYLEKWKP